MHFHARILVTQCLEFLPSRSGEPKWDLVTGSHERPSWASSVQWTRADILKPETYKPFLGGASAVVHTMGILLEADYKGVVQGRESIFSGLQRAFSSSKLGSQNIRQRKEGEALQPQEKDGQLTYELMNRDSGSCTPKNDFITPNKCIIPLRNCNDANMVLVLVENNSYRIGARILQRESSDLRIHLCRQRCTNPSKQVYHN